MQKLQVLGEPVEILTNSDTTAGRSTTFIQLSPPGGGPPPHSHRNEDETFYVLEGEYEFLLNGGRHRSSAGDVMHAMRGSVHTFRNAGDTEGKLLIVAVPGGFERYLEAISAFSVPADMRELVRVSEDYGITFAIE